MFSTDFVLNLWFGIAIILSNTITIICQKTVIIPRPLLVVISIHGFSSLQYSIKDTIVLSEIMNQLAE